MKWVKKDKKRYIFWPTKEMKEMAWISKESIYKEAARDPKKFWAKLAKKGLFWYKKWNKIYTWTPPYFKWFVGGKLNACYNTVDRHLETWRRNKAALIWVPEPVTETRRVLTYYDLYNEVNKLASVLKKFGVRRGDTVGIYLPMIPEVIISMLACARIGAIHSVVFSAFSAASLKDRLGNAGSKVLITADGYYRRGKIINLKRNADNGVKGTKVKRVIVVKRCGVRVGFRKGRDYWWHNLMKEAGFCEPAKMNSDDPLFILYTSGTTGKPKGVIHDTGGYLTQAYWTAKWDFDLKDEDVFWCTADVGWVTGHTYGCYGPLSVGATSIIYEGSIDYPDPGRMWKIAEENGVTVFYTAPTAIRMFMKFGDKWPKKYDLSRIRILGTVGEPIDKDAWRWYFRNIGGSNCPVIDTWWQTETGGTLINALPGIGAFIPTVAGRSFPGTRHTVLNDKGKPAKVGQEGFLVQLPPFAPGMLHGVYKNPKKYKEEYWERFGDKVYYTSDGAKVDKAGNIRLVGRMDDVMKVAGHRIATAELENAIDEHRLVDECAVVPMKHSIKGQVPVAFVILKKGKPSKKLEKEVVKQVERKIGPIARPGKIYFVKDLPKTRSGKIMRRILRGLLNNDTFLGNLTTLMNPESVEYLKGIVGYKG